VVSDGKHFSTKMAVRLLGPFSTSAAPPANAATRAATFPGVKP
jgi:hypothetical protein